MDLFSRVEATITRDTGYILYIMRCPELYVENSMRAVEHLLVDVLERIAVEIT
jgi:hypothetical protein